MKSWIPLIIALGLALALGSARAAEKKRFLLYAVLTETCSVDLSDGARWIMDRGDTFPLQMFKENQTILILQLAGVNFRVEAGRAKVLEEKDVTPEQMETYRKNVQTYLTNRSRQWKDKATRPPQPGKPLALPGAIPAPSFTPAPAPSPIPAPPPNAVPVTPAFR